MIAGQLELVLMANMARLQNDMDAAKRSVGGAMADIEKMAAMAKSALGALGGVLSVSMFVGWVHGAIEAADSLNDLSKSTGIAVEQLAGLKLAAQQSGADLEGTAQAINKLSVKMGENADKYASIGVTAKQPLEAFKQLADIFNKIDDPQKRAAFGAEALGKSWGSAAPLLAEGSAGIQEMVDKGILLSGMTQDAGDQADAFNDRMAELKTISGAAALGIAKDVMPIITAFAESMVESKGDTDDLAGAFPKLSEVLRVFIVFGGNVAFTLAAIGREIGGIAAQAAAVASGDFKAAFGKGGIGDMMKEDAEKARAAFDKWEAKMLSAGTTATDTAKKVVKAAGSQTEAEKAALAAFIAGENEKKAAKNQLDTAFESFAADAAKREAILTAEAGGVAKLTDAEKWALETMVKVRDGKLGQSDVERKLIGERVAAVVALEKLNTEEKRAADLEAKAMALRADAINAEQDKAQSLIEATGAMREQTAELGLTTDALAALKLARIDDQIASESRRLAMLSEMDQEGAMAGSIRETIAALEDRKAAMDENDSAQRAADAIKAQGDAWKSIEDTAHQTFVSIFDSGKSAFDRLEDTLKNGLLDLLYQMTLKKWVVSIAASVSGTAAAESAFGTTATAGGSATGSLGSIGNLASGAKSAYEIFSNGAANTYNNMASSSLGQSLGLSTAQSAGYMAPVYGPGGVLISEGTGTAAGGLTELGSSIGTSLAYSGAGLLGTSIGNAIAGDKRIISGISTSSVGAVAGGLAGSLGMLGSIAGPLGAGIGGVVGGLFDAAFGMGDKEYTDGGIRGTFSGASFSGEKYQNWEQDGGWFRSDDDGTDTSPIDASTLNSLSASFTMLKLQTGQLAAGLGVDTANIAAYSKDINLTLTGDAAADATAITNMIAGISEDMSSLVLAGTNFGLAGETSSETLSRLYNSLTTVNQAFASINVSAYETSLAGGDMASQLALLMGGIDAFKTSITSYYGTYFSAEEQQADLVKQTTASIKALGVEVPTTKDEFRALVESLDMTTDSGRKTFASLMSVEAAFAQMTDAADAAAEAVKSLIDSAVSSRASIFYSLATDDQKLVVAAQQIESGFSALGLSIPKTKDEFYALAAVADVTTAAGQSLIAALSAMEPAFATVADAAEAAQQKWLDAVVAAAEATQQAIIARNEKSASEHSSLQTQWYQLMGNTVELRKAELAVLEQENQALQENIWAYQDAQAAVTAAASASDAALSAVQASTEAQKTKEQAAVTAAKSASSAIKGVFDTLKSAIENLYSQVSSTSALAATSGNAFIADALAKAKATGALPDSSELSKAISSAESSIGAGASTFEADRARLVLAGQLQQLQDIAGTKLSDSETALKAAQDQLAATEAIYKNAQDQLNTLRGVGMATLSVADAVEALQVAMTGEKTDRQKLAEAAAGKSASSSGGGGGLGPYNPGYILGVTTWNAARIALLETAVSNMPGNNYAGTKEGLISEIASLKAYDAAAATASYNAHYSPSEISQAISYGVATGSLSSEAAAAVTAANSVASAAAAVVAAASNGTSIAAASSALSSAAAANMPSFAVGANYIPHDMTARIHEGEAIIPRAFNPWAGGRAENDDGVIAELRAVKAELIEARKQRDISNARLARIEAATNGNPDRPVLVEVAA